MVNQRMPQTQKFFEARVTVKRSSETIIPHRIDLKESQFVEFENEELFDYFDCVSIVRQGFD